MTEINLTQAEADSLFKMEKIADVSYEWDFPTMGMKIEIPLISQNKKEQFLLDIGRGTINLQKIKYQNRARQVVILVRIDLAGPPHRNPDGSEVASAHLHQYKEGFGDKWAYPIPQDKFHNLDDQWETLQNFMNFCNISKKPIINRVMF
jgi:hypothetical protein